MHLEEVAVEGIHVSVNPKWKEKVDHEVAHLERHHPGRFTRVTVRFKAVRPHHPGMCVSIDGRIDQHSVNVEREGHNVLGLIHEAFEVVNRQLDDKAKTGHKGPGLHADGDAELEATEDDDVDETTS